MGCTKLACGPLSPCEPPLADTAVELCAVARLTGAGPDSVYLGANATEAKVEFLIEAPADEIDDHVSVMQALAARFSFWKHMPTLQLR